MGAGSRGDLPRELSLCTQVAGREAGLPGLCLLLPGLHVVGGMGTHARLQSHMFQKFDLRTAFFPPQERDVWRKCSR